jgi:hypothetical protein
MRAHQCRMPPPDQWPGDISSGSIWECDSCHVLYQVVIDEAIKWNPYTPASVAAPADGQSEPVQG